MLVPFGCAPRRTAPIQYGHALASSTSRSQLTVPSLSLSLLVALIRKLVVLLVVLALVILAHQLSHLESRPCRLCAPFLVAEGRALLA